jgi:hypothetical protein
MAAKRRNVSELRKALAQQATANIQIMVLSVEGSARAETAQNRAFYDRQFERADRAYRRALDQLAALPAPSPSRRKK